jgi:hypothetical protein
VADVPTGYRIEGNTHETISLLIRPRRQADVTEPLEFCHIIDRATSADHQHTPAFVVEVIYAINFEGRHLAVGGRIELTSPTGAEHDGPVVDGVVDRVDDRASANNGPDPTHPMCLESTQTLLSIKNL